MVLGNRRRFGETPAGRLCSPSQVGFERMIFLEPAYAEHAETDDKASLVHAFHQCTACSRAHVTGRVRKGDFEVISFEVKPHFYFIDHNVFPDLRTAVKECSLISIPVGRD